jgi:vacuolar-type H+-ATPase subunit H
MSEQDPSSREISVVPEEHAARRVPQPADQAVSIVDLLPDRAEAIGSLSQLLGEHAELEQLLASEPVSPMARAIIGRLIEQQSAEREAFLSALRVYKEETARLALDVSQARAELSQQIEIARAERDHLIGEFLDRVDQLSAKISTSAARYSAQLDEKDVLLEDAEKRVEVYAGHAANAQSVIADMRKSSSWRLTAPIRLMSRLLAREGAPKTAQHND